MLQIKNLTITHLKDFKTLLRDFSFTLNKGDKVAIIGEEGNGKSTLLKLIYDENLISSYAEYTGEIIKANIKLGYLAQELPEGQKAKSVFEYFSDIPAFQTLAPNELSAIESRLGLSSGMLYSDQTVGTLSGGEKVKMQLAEILMARPDVLLLDEPSNDIDIGTLEWLENFINSCGLAVLFVSHDEILIENTANIIIHLEQVRRKTLPRYNIEKKPYKKYIEERQAKLLHQEQVARKEQNEYEKQQQKLRQIQAKVEHQQNTISRADPQGGRLLKKKMKTVISMGKRFERERENMTQVPDVEEAIMLKFGEDASIPNGKSVLDFELDHLCVGSRTLSKHIRLIVTGPQKVCIIGKNGAGKTTLLKSIAQNLLARTDLKAAYMPQNYEELLNPQNTPVEFLSKTGHKDEITKIKTFLGSVKYTPDEMEHAISEISGGQKGKLLF